MFAPRTPRLLGTVSALVALLAVVPVAYLVDRAVAGGLSAAIDELWRERTIRLMVRSLLLSAVVTACAAIVGTVSAWLVERTDLVARSVLRVVFALPLAIPSYLAAFSWISWRPSVAGFWGAVLVLTSVSYPFVYLPVGAALRRTDPAQDEVARALGRSRLAIALRLTLRQVRPSVAAGALLVMLYALSDFGAVAAMRYQVFTWEIYGAYRAGFDPNRAAVLASALVVIGLVVVLAEQRARGQAAPARVGRGASRLPSPIRLGAGRLAGGAFAAVVVAVALAFPVVRVITWVVSYASTDVSLGDVIGPLGHTVLLAVLAASATMAVALPVGILAARHGTLAARLFERATYVVHALPGIVIAISMVYVGVRILRPVYLETPLLVLGYVVLLLPLAVANVRAAVEQAPQVYEEMSASLGRRRWATFWRVTLPLAAPGLAAGAALVALSVMKELPVTLVLRPTTTHTLATELWKYTTVSDYGNAGLYALALVVFAAVPTALLAVASMSDQRQRRAPSTVVAA